MFIVFPAHLINTPTNTTHQAQPKAPTATASRTFIFSTLETMPPNHPPNTGDPLQPKHPFNSTSSTSTTAENKPLTYRQKTIVSPPHPPFHLIIPLSLAPPRSPNKDHPEGNLPTTAADSIPSSGGLGSPFLGRYG